MSLIYKTGNIFEDDAACLINPVNCVGVMGKGLALEFKKKFPEVFTVYKKLCASGELSIGRVAFYQHIKSGKTICLFPTKHHWMNKSTMDIINTSLEQFVKYAPEAKLTSVAFPQIGCGLGGLSFVEEVRPLMERHLRNLSYDIRIYI